MAEIEPVPVELIGIMCRRCGMTESEAINRLRDHFRIHDDGRPTPYLDDAVSMAINALEEVEKYRNIGVVSADELEQDLLLYKADREVLSMYNALGTVEELKIAKEKQIPKKPIMKPYFEDMEEEYLCCPTCGDILTDRIPLENKDFYFHCLNCGQKLDWSDTD